MADRSVVVRLVANTAGFSAPLKAAATQAKAFGAELDSASKKNDSGFRKVAEGATVAGAGILAAFGGAVAVTMQFDKQMSAVGAAAGATSAQLGQLRDAAIEAGSATAYGATDAARAQEELAKAGVSVTDILNGGLTGALDLAAAGQMDLGEAAEIAATAMTQFKLSGDQVPHVADLLSAAANNAQGSVHDMGFALKSGGLVAAQFGISVEETTGTLASFASAGLIGSDAGTSLKTMLIALANPSEKSAELMSELGINAYDASGKFVGLSNLAGQLQAKLGDLSQEQRNQALAQIFGSDAMRAASVLYEQGAQGISDWTNKVNDSGNAARTAAAKMDNLSGDVEKLKGSLETALIQTGSEATGTLRFLTQAADGAVSSYTQLPGPVKEVATVLGLTVGAALLAGAAYGTLAPKIRESRAALEAMGPAGEKANAALGKTAKVAGAAVGAFAVLQIAGLAITKADQALRDAGPDADALADGLTKLASSGKETSAVTEVLGKNFKNFGSDAKWMTGDGWTSAARGLSNFSQGLRELVGIDIDFLGPFDDAKKRIQETDEALTKMVQAGNLQGAELSFDKLAAAAAKQGVSLDELKKQLPGYTAAIEKARAANDSAAATSDRQTVATKQMAGGFKEAAQAVDGLKSSFDSINGAMLTTDQALLKASEAIDKVKESFKANGTAIDGNSQAALRNRVAIGEARAAAIEAAQAKMDETGSVEQARAVWDTYTGQLRATLIQMGLSKAAADNLIATYGTMPPMKATQVSAPGTTQATSEVQKLNQEIAAIKDRQAKIGQSGAQDADRQISALQSKINALQDKIVRITYFESRIVTSGSGEQAMHGSRWGNVFSYATGGVAAKIAGPGTLYQWAEPATGGEAFIPRLGNYERSMGILQTAASWYGAQVTGGRASRPAAVAASPAVQAAAPMASGPSIDYRKLGRALAAAMGDVQVTIDGRRVGAIQGREADLFSRAG